MQKGVSINRSKTIAVTKSWSGSVLGGPTRKIGPIRSIQRPTKVSAYKIVFYFKNWLNNENKNVQNMVPSKKHLAQSFPPSFIRSGQNY